MSISSRLELDGEAHRPQKLSAYNPRPNMTYKGLDVCQLVTDLLGSVTEVVGQDGIDGIGLPELAVTPDEYKRLKVLAWEKDIMLVAGIRATTANQYFENKLGMLSR